MRASWYLWLGVVLLAFDAICGEQSDTIKSNQHVDIFNETIRLNCRKEVSLDNADNFGKISEIKDIKEFIIDSCALPSGSYADILRNINVNISEVKKLTILNPQLAENHDSSVGPNPERPESLNFVDLNLEELKLLNNDSSSLLGINLDFLGDILLKKLTLENVETWSQFPNSSKIQIMELTNGIFHGNIGGCSKLKELYMNNMSVVGDEEKWLKNCFKLDKLQLYNISSDSTNKILRDLPYSIRNITLQYCSLESFPDKYRLIKSADLGLPNKVVRYIDVSHNNIKYGPSYHLFQGLETMDISYNKLTHFDKYDLYSDGLYQSNLLEIKLDGNDFSGICDKDYGILRIRQKKEDDWKYHKELDTPLKRLSLSNTGLPYLCFGSVLVPHLEWLDVSYNNLTELDYRTFYWVSNDHLEVDMRHNPLKKVAFTKEDYQSMKRNDPAVTRWSKMTVRVDAPLPCDCTLAWFARAVRERLLSVQGMTCKDGSNIEDPDVFKSC